MVERAVRALDGVVDASVDFEAKEVRVVVEGDEVTAESLAGQLNAAGGAYTYAARPEEGRRNEDGD